MGLPGSGKTLSMVNKIVNSPDKWYHNINGLKWTNAERLKWDMILLESGDKKTREIKPNWDFWQEQKKKGPVNICLDEIGNIYGSRTSMSKRNIVINAWMSQIRKLTSSTGNHHLYLILQRLKSLDVFARNLADEVIQCRLYKAGPEIPTVYRFNGRLHRKLMKQHLIRQRHFISDERQSAEDKFECYMATGEKTWNYTTVISNANILMQYYDSYDIVEFDGVDSYV